MIQEDQELLRRAELTRRRLLHLLAGSGATAALASGIGLNARRSARAAQGVALPADAASEQVLRAATGSTGANSFVFSPLRGGGDQQNWQTLLWTPPLYFDEGLTLQPGVFASWESDADGVVWTFRVDPRATWSDGSPITTADFKGTWELMTDPLTEHGRITGYIGNVQGFDAVRNGETTDMSGLVAVDDATLQVTLAKPDPVFNWRIATAHMNAVKPDQARPAPNEFWLPENNPLVSGPYMLSAYDPDGGEAEMVKNPNWWMDEGPFLEKITFRFVPDQQVVTTLVQNDEIDCSLAPLTPELRTKFPDYFRPMKAFGFNVYWINMSAPPTDDVDVRKALTLAVNFDDVFKSAYPTGEGATRATQIVDLDLPCVDSDPTWFAYDPEGAKAALAASSYGSADSLPKIRVTPRADYPPLQRGLETIIEFWRQNLGITNVEFKTRPDEFGPDADKINISRDDAVIRFPDTATYMWTAAHSAGPIARPGANPGESMLGGYKNDQVDALIEEALALPPDDPRRCELSLQAQQLYLDDYPVMAVADEQATINTREYVKNYAKGPDVSLIQPWRIYIAQH